MGVDVRVPQVAVVVELEHGHREPKNRTRDETRQQDVARSRPADFREHDEKDELEAVEAEPRKKAAFLGVQEEVAEVRGDEDGEKQWSQARTHDGAYSISFACSPHPYDDMLRC